MKLYLETDIVYFPKVFNSCIIFYQIKPYKEIDVILQGLTLTIVGMTVVFIFLTLLVYAMKLLSIIVLKVAPESIPSKQPPLKQKSLQPAVQPTAQVSNDAEIAAAVAAVRAFTTN